jgi:hypothetical protein
MKLNTDGLSSLFLNRQSDDDKTGRSAQHPGATVTGSDPEFCPLWVKNASLSLPR